MATEINTKITLEQWRALVAVIDASGYAAAAEALGKSQSAVTYAIQQIEAQLKIKVFQIQGRKAVPTSTGQMLYRRARQLLDEAQTIEAAAYQASAGVEANVRIAIDVLIPAALTLCALAHFAEAYPDTRVELIESVLSGSEDALVQHEVDLAVSGRVPPGFIGTALLRIHMQAVAAPRHPLFLSSQPLTMKDLRRYRQLVVRDSGPFRRRSEGWLDAEQRWTVSHMNTSVQAVREGLGYAWLPHTYIQDDLQSGRLRLLPLAEGGERFVEMYLIFADSDSAGPATRLLADVLTKTIKERCIDAAPD